MKNKTGTIAGILAIASIFLWEFSIVPIAAICLGVYSLINIDSPDAPKSGAILGIVGGIMYLAVRIIHG